MDSTEELKLHCCMPECDKPAEWEIYWGPTADDCTHSCSEHTGELLEENTVNTLTPIAC